MHDNALETEISAFQAMLPELRRTHGPVWAVLVGADFKGGFREFSKAAEFAVSNFSGKPFLIRHTEQHPAHIPFLAIDA